MVGRLVIEIHEEGEAAVSIQLAEEAPTNEKAIIAMGTLRVLSALMSDILAGDTATQIGGLLYLAVRSGDDPGCD